MTDVRFKQKSKFVFLDFNDFFSFFSDGCCYNPRDETINYMLSSFKINNQGTDVRKFAETLNQTFDDIRQLIEENSRTNIKSKL